MKVTQNKLTHLRSLLLSYDTLCAIWYQLYNLENVEKKNPWRSVTFSEVAGFCIMGNIGRNLGKMLLGLVMATKQINKNISFLFVDIRTLQSILLKVVLVLGGEVHTGVSFKHMVEPKNEESGWTAAFEPENLILSKSAFNVVIGADGKKNVLPGFPQIELRGKK